MNKTVSVIIIALFVAMGTALASGVSFQTDSHGCRSAVPMDCCAGISGQSFQPTGQMDCCGTNTNKADQAQVNPVQNYLDQTISDCGNSFCGAPSQPSCLIVKNPRHFSDGGVQLQLYYSQEVPTSQVRAGALCLPEITGPPVPLYTRYCVLRY